MWVDLCIFILVSTINWNITAAEKNFTGCDQEPSCLKCGPDGCIKCADLIIYPSRKCVIACPPGYRSKWSTMADYLGRVCLHSGYFLGMSGEMATILTGALCGVVASVVLVASAVAYLRYKKRRMCQRVDTNSDVDDKPERRDFLKQLEALRPHGHTLLDMLNDTRRQLRELRQEGDNSAAAAYKPVVRDLAKVLLLLNRPAESTLMPDDWEHLFNWAEKALKRYKRMSEVSVGQVAQLIDFLQGPVATSLADLDAPRQTTLSTFKPELNFNLGSSLSLNEAKAKVASTNGFSGAPLNPQWRFNYPLVTNNPLYASEFSSLQWKNSKEYLGNAPYLLEDDFFQLGFRPQDEITTEL